VTITYHTDIVQGTDEWAEIRRGILTASEMKLILSPTLKPSNNEKTRAHLYELLAQRISGFVEPHFVGFEMERGHEEEILARSFYSQKYAPVDECGFVTNDRWGFRIGYSPDGLVGDNGLIECKSRRQKYQVETIIADEPPEEFILQLQTGLLVTEREWIDYISYSGGLPMLVKRVYPDERIQAAIVEAATAFEKQIAEKLAMYRQRQVEIHDRLTKTERTVYEDISV
jgi:hypothetical protein